MNWSCRRHSAARSQAIRQNPARVAALGGRVYFYKLAAFTASGMIAALSGALKVQHINFISPDLVSWFVSGDVLIAVVIGGIGTLVGGPLGATLLVMLKEALSSTFGHWYLFLGIIFAGVALLMPKGIVGYLLDLYDRHSRRDRRLPANPEDAAVIALETRSLNKSFGSLAVTQEVSLAFEQGLRYAIIGPNGAGKTTYFNLLAGNLRPDSGAVLFEDRDVTRLDVTARARIGIARSFQRNSLFPEFTVRDNLTLACALREGLAPVFWRPMRRLTALHAEADDDRRAGRSRRHAGHPGPPDQLWQPAPARSRARARLPAARAAARRADLRHEPGRNRAHARADHGPAAHLDRHRHRARHGHRP